MSLLISSDTIWSVDVWPSLFPSLKKIYKLSRRTKSNDITEYGRIHDVTPKYRFFFLLFQFSFLAKTFTASRHWSQNNSTDCSPQGRKGRSRTRDWNKVPRRTRSTMLRTRASSPIDGHLWWSLFCACLPRMPRRGLGCWNSTLSASYRDEIILDNDYIKLCNVAKQRSIFL